MYAVIFLLLNSANNNSINETNELQKNIEVCRNVEVALYAASQFIELEPN